ncbi:MAG: hypothetical protein NWF06_00685 [Candidatus Bathyarchaeota archaeon]|nr:hypothetical protein [Candidatus Bathyarchaeum sp.]
MTVPEVKEKECFGFNRCWNQVRAKCKLAELCKEKNQFSQIVAFVKTNHPKWLEDLGYKMVEDKDLNTYFSRKLGRTQK